MAQTTQTDDGSDEQNIKTTVFSALRDNDLACALVERTIQGEVVPTVYTAFDGEFAEIKVESRRPTKMKKHKLAREIDNAEERNDNVRIIVPSQVEMNVEEKLERLTDDEEKSREETSPKAYSEDKYADVADDGEHFEHASAPRGTSDVHGGGW